VTRPKPGAVRGRPRFPDATARRIHLDVRVSPADLTLLDRLAAELGETRAGAVRAAVERWARSLGLA
jgi:hypothetical protein